MDAFVKKWINDNYGKKTIVIYGNCHTTAIRFLLDQLDLQKKGYAIFPFAAIQDVKDPEYFNNGIIHNCDIFIHQVIRTNNRYGIEWSSEEILKKTKSTCNVIGIPNVYHLPTCFFQQYSEKKDFRGRNNNTYFFRDEILDNAFINRWTLKKTADYYNHYDFKASGLIEKEFEGFIEKVSKREEDWDIKILDFILEKYKEYKLFFDPNHPTPIFIREIVCRLLKYMGIPLDIDILNKCSDFSLDSFEMPICGCVKHALGLKYSESEIRRTGIKFVKTSMNLEEYIREYWSYEWQNEEISVIRRSTCAMKYLKEAVVRKII